MNPKTFPWLLKRELWEHRSFWIVPGVLAGLILFFMLWGLSNMVLQGIELSHLREEITDLSVIDPETRQSGVTVAILSSAAPFNVFMLVMLVFYLLDALYADRRDRSILFWKSLPVSDAGTVLSKLAMAMVVIPGLTWSVIIATQLVGLIFISIAGAIIGVEGWYLLWDPVGLLGGWFTLAYAFLMQSLIFAPFMGWLLLASSWARKAPFLWAFVPPAVVMMLEEWLLDTNYLFNWTAARFTETMPIMFNIRDRGAFEELAEGPPTSQVLPNLDLFLSPGLWSGFLVAGVLVAGAIWLRRYRDDNT